MWSSVQAFQLRYGRDRRTTCRTNTWECLDATRAALLSAADHEVFTVEYSFHRLAEARLRIVTNRPLNEPEARDGLEKLAH